MSASTKDRDAFVSFSVVAVMNEIKSPYSVKVLVAMGPHTKKIAELTDILSERCC